MSARQKRDPMTAFHGFILGPICVNAITDLILQHWHGAITEAIVAGLFWGWDSSERRVAYLERAIRKWTGVRA